MHWPILRLQSSGRWAVCPPGHSPIELTSGDVFQVEVKGVLKPTRMEFAHGERGRPGQYYSIDGFELRTGMRAAVGAA